MNLKKIIANTVVLALALGVVIWVGAFISGIVSAVLEDSKDYPGKALFEKEDHKIDVYGGTDAFGNSPEALAVAGAFSHELQVGCQGVFTGGSKFTPATAGHFLTYCRVTPDAVVILCQVPDLRGYRDDVLDALSTLAWALGQGAVKKANIGGDKTPLVVALRGFGSYGPIMEGTLTGDPTARIDGLMDKKQLYPYFIKPTAGD